jgi:hypothetical protein
VILFSTAPFFCAPPARTRIPNRRAQECQASPRVSLNGGKRSSPSFNFALIAKGYWIRTALERFDWRATMTLRKKERRKWDAIKQLIRYKEVVGRDVPISAESIQTGTLFVEPAGPAE